MADPAPAARRLQTPTAPDVALVPIGVGPSAPPADGLRRAPRPRVRPEARRIVACLQTHGIHGGVVIERACEYLTDAREHRQRFTSNTGHTGSGSESLTKDVPRPIASNAPCSIARGNVVAGNSTPGSCSSTP